MMIENVGRPLVGLLIGNEDFILSCPGDPQGASLHFLHNSTTKTNVRILNLINNMADI